VIDDTIKLRLEQIALAAEIYGQGALFQGK
jgi:hypothetical protein